MWQFYRVQIGIQSPKGITTTRTVLRRFNDFLKLHAAVSAICWSLGIIIIDLYREILVVNFFTGLA